MTHSTEPKDWKFVKGYGLFSIPENIGKNISRNLGGKYSQKTSWSCKQSATNAIKTASKIAIQKIK